MKNDLIVISNFALKELFLKEMYTSQKYGELNASILAVWDDFLTNCADENHEVIDNIVEVAAMCSEKDNYQKYCLFIADFLAGRNTEVSNYQPSNKEVFSKELELIKEKLRASKEENKKLKDSVEESQKLVMEAIDLMMSM